MALRRLVCSLLFLIVTVVYSGAVAAGLVTNGAAVAYATLVILWVLHLSRRRARYHQHRGHNG